MTPSLSPTASKTTDFRAPASASAERSPWIYGTSARDAAWLYWPGIIALVLSFYFRGEESDSLLLAIYVFVGLSVLDAGHVYVTIWRTYLHPTERRRSPVYIYLPPLLALFFFSWVYFRIPFLGPFIVYMTIFHNMRQFYGISKWYQKQNGVMRPVSDRFFYFLSLMPFLMGHLRSDQYWSSYYSPHDIFSYPSPKLFAICQIIYSLGIGAWLFYEMGLRRQAKEWNRFFSVGFPALLYGLCFLKGHTYVDILLPLVVSHGASYLGLTSLALARTRKRVFSLRKAVVVVALTALICGLVESRIDRTWPETPTLMFSIVMALYLTPLFCHYIFDAFLWKKSHPEAGLIYQPARVEGEVT